MIITKLDGGTIGNVLNKSTCSRSCQVTTTNCAGAGSHDFNEYLNGDCEYELNSDMGIQIYQTCSISCDNPPERIDDGGDSGGDQTGGGGGSPGDGDVITNPNPTEPCNSADDGDIGITGPDGCITDINDDDDDVTINPTNPCANLDSLLENEDIKNKIAALKSPEVLNLDYEKGFILKTDDTGISDTPIQGNTNAPTVEISFTENGEYPDGSHFGIIHTHYNGLLPSFSIEDIKTFHAAYQFREFSGKPLKDLTSIVVTSSGVFAMLIDDVSIFGPEGRKLHSAEFSSIKEEIDKKIEKGTLSNNNVSLRNLIDEVLPDYGLKLYKASEDLSSWGEVKPQTTNTTKITTEPCN